MRLLPKIALILSFVLLSNTVLSQGWTVNPADYSFSGQVTVVVNHGSSLVTTGTLGAFVGGTCRGYVNGTFFPPTSKTVFTVICYSNLSSGETLTFKYFDPSDGSYYDISETLGFVSDMIVGSAIAPLQYHTLPLFYSVTGVGSYCEGGPGLPVGLSGSESGVTYTLLKNGTAQVPTVDGTGSAITFGNQLGATYTISGTNSGGTVMMTGNAVIVENPLPLVPVSNAGSGATCTQITANWTASSNSTSYLLDVSTAIDFSTYLPGYQDLDVGNVTNKSIPGLVAGTPYYYRVRGNNSCGTSGNSTTIAYSTSPATPATPGAITGTAAQCPALTAQTYSIAAVTNATTYTWTVPTGWTITAGQGTTSVTVTTGATGQNGNITVTAGNSCGTSTANSLAVSVLAGTPATPAAITGTAAQCPALTGQTYSISAVTNATTYTWTVPTGWTITAGQGTTSVTVTTGATGQNGNIMVTAGNSCGTSTANSLAVSVLAGTPATPGTITGTAAQCPALTAQTYSIAAVTNATTYTWTVPTGWTITSGQGTTSVTVTTGATGQNGNITVTAGNSCGTSTANSLAVTVLAGTPATPAAITGTAAQCPALTGQTYSISAVTNATTYTWTVPTGWTITSGQGTTSVTVTTGSTGQNGNITVTAGNSCGTSTANSLAVTVLAGTPATPAAITGTAAQCPALTGQAYSIAAVTNATTYTWTVPTGWTITAGQGTISIAITTGATGQNGNITVTAGNSCGTSAANSLAVTVLAGTPATPAAITGTAAQCPALTGQAYSISAVTNATTYTWTVPTGWTITAGQGTTSVTVTTGATGQNGNITVTAGNSCGTSTANSLAVSVLAGTPATPAAITGTAAQCPALTGQAYSIAAVTNATTYTWTVPTGWTITSGQGTTSVTVTTGSTGQNGNITVTAGNSCGTSTANSLAVTVLAGTPATPGAITGTAAQCPALTGQTYSISAVTNATTYTWTVPTGWTITSGQGTISIAVTTGSTGQNGNITVTAGNSCGTSAANTLAVTVLAGTPATPGAITGTAAQCPALTGQTYSIAAVTNATTYTWTVPTGWTITSGQGTISIAVTTGATGQNGNITVTAGNSCGTSTANSLAVTVLAGTPATPGAITGTAAQCPALTGQAYSISAVTNATTYTWTVPTGWTITSGQGTISVTVTTGSTGQNGNITVTAGNSCGTSAANTLAVTVLAGTPATPGTITGTAAQCPALTGQAYSISAVTNATTYTWTVPTGWTITAGQGTISIAVTTGATGQNGNITVTAGNSCGTSAANTLAVTVLAGTPATPGAITGTAAQCPALTGQTYSIAAVTNATTYTWTVPTGWTITSGQGTISIAVTTGATGQNGNITVTAGNSCGTSTANSLAVTVLAGTPATPAAITGTAAQCPALTGQAYSIAAVTNATTYTWTVPTGWTITAGQGTISIAITTGATGQNGNITVTAGNSCGTSAANSLAVTVLAGTPATPAAITGTAAQCPALTGQAYSISAVTNATTYTWTVPTGWTITAGQGTISITVTTGATGQNGNITVTAGNSCGTSTANSLAVSVLAGTPATPAAITGTAAQCPALTGQAYSIAAVTNATTYTWTVPTGWTITSGQGTISVTVTTGATGQNGNITVTAGNSCGTSAANSLAVVVIATPVTPGSITGSATQCPVLTGQTYSISSVTNATTYTWAVPAGWVISAGQGTTSVTVTTGSSGQNGNITVTAGNSCGTSAASSLAVTVSPGTPASPGLITGTAAQCPVLTGQIYSIAAVTNATTYTWTAPAGWTITAGQGTTSVTVTTGATGQNGNITVTAGNSCGTSSAGSLAVTVVSLSTSPTGISITNNNTCNGTTKTLSVTGGSLGSGASWQWYTVSCGGTLAGTGTSITSDPPAGTNTVYYVLASGTCNTTSCASGTVVVTPTVGTPTTPVPAASTICQGTASTTLTTSATNATSYNWTVSGSGNSISGTGTTGTVTWSSSFTGTATVSVTANGCGGPSPAATTTITVRPTPTASISGTATVCQNSASPNITFANPMSLPVTVTYNINGGTNNTISVGANSSSLVAVSTSAPGIFVYNLVGVNYSTAPSCLNSLSLSATVTVNAVPVATLSSSDADNIICAGSTVTFTAGGGTNYNFRIGGTTVQNGASATYTTSSLTNGQVVDVIVTNSSGCSSNSSAITNFVNPLPFIFISTAPSCAADLLTYSLGVTVSSGTVTSTAGTVTNAGGNIWSVTGVPSGTNITVKVTDLNTCENTLTVTAPNCSCPVVQAPVSGGDKSYCQSGTIPTLSVTVSTGETADWYNAPSGGTLLKSASLTYTPAGAGTYYAMARNTTTGCVSSTRTVVILTMNSLPVPSLISSDPDNIFCLGTSITFTGGGGTNYNFRVAGAGVQNGASATYTTSSLANGQTVDVIVTNSNGCSATSSAITNTVNPLPSPTLTSSDADNKFCSGTSVTFTAGGGNSYVFRIDGVSVQSGSTSTYTTSSLTNGQVADVIVTNSNGCSANSAGISNTVYSLPNPTLTSSDPDNIFCSGTTVIFTGGGGTNYNFRVAGATVQNGSSSTYTTSALTNGQIVDVIVTNANGCTANSGSITNTVNSLPAAVIISSDADNKFCAGTSVTFTAAGGTTYNFRVGGISVQNSASSSFTTSSLTNGQVVDVIVTNANGCSATSSGITNTVYALPAAAITSSDADNILCAGTSVTFTASGGNNYVFRVSGTIVQSGTLATYSTSTLNNGQVVDVIVTNANGCTSTSAGITNFVNPLPLIFVTTPAACSADLATYSLVVTVGSGVVTSTAGTVTNTSGTVWSITGVPSGTPITVKVKDANGCENFLSITPPDCSCPVIQAPVSGGNKSYCAGGAVPSINATVSSGETVDWYNASSGGTLLKSSSLTYTAAGAGTYYAQTRNTTTGCISSSRTAITVTMNAVPVPTLSGSDPDNKFCYGTSVTFTAGGGTSYNFRVDGVSVQNGASSAYTTSSLTNGQTVDVIVSNSSGCTAVSAGITNTVYALPVATLTSNDADNKFCLGTSVSFTSSGGTNYNFRVDGVSVQNGTSTTYTTSSLTNGQKVDVVVTNANGCSAISSGITNTVNALPAATLSSSDADNIFCAGNSITFTAGGGTSYNFRKDAVSIQIGTSSAFTTTTLTNGQTVDVIVTNANGCSATSAGITNTVNNVPVANAGPGGNSCNFNFNLSAVPSIGTGTWTKTTGPGTAVFSPGANSPNATVTVSDYGTYTFTWTEVNFDCSSSSVITVTFYQQPVANAGAGGNNCGLTYGLNATPSVGTGTWTKKSGTGTATFSPNANSPSATVAVSAFGIYSFTWTELNGSCSNSASVSVNFLQVPSANAGRDSSVCDNNFVLKAVPGSGSQGGFWSKNSGPGTAIFSSDSTLPNARVTVDQYGEYIFKWTEKNIICTSSDLVIIRFLKRPALFAGNDTVICRGNTIQLKATGTGTFLWSPDSLFQNPNIANSIALPADPIDLVVRLTDQNGCYSIDSIFVDVWDIPSAYAGPDTILQYNFNTRFRGGGLKLHESGLWTIISGSGLFSDDKDPVADVTDLALGINRFLWTITNGVCPVSKDTVNITVDDLLVPTLITPNGDQFNEYLVLKGLETLGKTELIIFDRKGMQVFKSANYNNDWNGLDNNGKPLPEDTYYYVLRSENGVSRSGYIVIRR